MKHYMYSIYCTGSQGGIYYFYISHSTQNWNVAPVKLCSVILIYCKGFFFRCFHVNVVRSVKKKTNMAIVFLSYSNIRLQYWLGKMKGICSVFDLNSAHDLCCKRSIPHLFHSCHHSQLQTFLWKEKATKSISENEDVEEKGLAWKGMD